MSPGPARVVAGLATVAVVVSAALVVRLWPPMPDPRALADIQAALDGEVATWVRGDELVRENGYLYAVDVAQLMLAAARGAQRATYEGLHPLALGFVVDRRDDPYTAGFVAWRVKPGTPPDASGTTEALRLARALWEGAAAFGRPDDAALARRILEGYGRHATVDHDVWLVRNYFNFGTRAFANDSYLVDYDPDFVATVAQATGDPALKTLAERSYALVRRARAPSGLIYDLVQPDIRTLVPDRDLTVFSPNDVVQLNNACTVAETVVEGAPEVARGVLDFAVAQRWPIKRYFLGRTGKRAANVDASVTTLTCLARLAAALGDVPATRRFAWRASWHWKTFLRDFPAPRAYTASEILLTLHALRPATPPNASNALP